MAGMQILELADGRKWEGRTIIEYSFLSELNTDIYSPTGTFAGFGILSAEQREAVRSVFDYLSTIIPITFVDVTGERAGDITFGFVDGPPPDPQGRIAAGFAIPPNGSPQAGDVFFTNQAPNSVLTGYGTEFINVALHEICHALGLQHPFSDQYHIGPTLSGIEDTKQFTVMSYTTHPNGYIANPTTLGLYDIAALQSLYGANYSTRALSNDSYDKLHYWGGNVLPYYCIWDAGGTDTLSAAGMIAPAILDLREGKFSSITSVPANWSWTNGTSADNISIAFGTHIENAVGTEYADLIVGNYLANEIEGGGGDDYIFGDGTIDDSAIDHVLADRNKVADSYTYKIDDTNLGSGDDELDGGGGNDQLWGGEGNDVLTGGDGNDYLFGGAGNDLLQDDGVSDAGPGDNTFDGGAGNDILRAGDGTDVLFGGSGIDFLFGGGGNDALYGDDDNEVDILVGGAGADDFYIGANDIVIDLDLEDRVFINGVQIHGGIDFEQWPNYGGISTDAFATGELGESYYATGVADVPNGDGWIPGSLSVVLPGAQGTAFLFGIQPSEYTPEPAGTLDGPQLFPGGISLYDTHPQEYYDDLLGYLTPQYAQDQITALYANGYTNGNAPSRPDLIIDVTDAAYQFLLEAGFEYSAGAWTVGSAGITLPTSNHAPTSIALSAYKIDENASGAVVGTLSVSDLDGQGGHTFTISDARLEIIDGQLRLKSGQSLDYESEQKVTVTVTATDLGGLSVQNVFTLFVNDRIEDVYGTSGNDQLVGGIGRDALYGLDGDDVLDGGEAADTLIGGKGNDTYYVDDAADVVVEAQGEGADTVVSSVTYTLATDSSVDTLVLAGVKSLSAGGNNLSNTIQGNSGGNQISGAAGDDSLFGNAGDDTLDGGDGNDSLTGGNGNDVLDGGVGADALLGGTGNDTYVVDDAGDTITEAAGEGTDTVQASVSYTLSANLEALVLTGTASISGTGNSGANTITGNSSDNLLDGAGGNDLLEGGDGNDTYRFGYGSGQDQIKDLVGGATPVDVLDLLSGVNVADVNVSKSGTSLFIRLAGTNDRVEVLNYFSGDGIDKIHFADNTEWTRSFIDGLFLTGSTGNDTLTGNADNNWISGNGGTDKLIGGLGSDYYVVDSSGDIVSENANEGYDVVESSITHTLGANIEGLILTGANVNGTGNALDNRLIGSSGINTLNGGAGADLMIGAAGNDIYVVDNAGDQVVEYAGEGTDTVQSVLGWTLGDTVENLTLTGSANIAGTGNAANNTLTGNSGANTLTGLDGNDTLDGGTGADALTGGAGNDTYTVDNVGDAVTEADGEGADLVKSSITYALGSYVENLTLTGSSTLNGTGNDLDNILTGNTGANQLTGGLGNDTLDGGTGADKLFGGAGNDTYVVDNVSDQITENDGEGTDLIKSSVAITLGAYIENLTFTGSSALNGIGNALDNVLTGNSGANQLSGADGNDTLDGGSGADKLTGGLGDDVYVVDNASDQIVENIGEGVDLLKSSVTYTLAANVENFTLTGSSQINGTGNELDNLITGNSGANILQGGLGNDVLNGSGGNDSLSGQDGIDSLLGGAGNDTLTWDADDTLDGGSDRDTLLYGLSGTLDIDTSKVGSIEVINLGVGDDNDNGIALNLADILDLAASSSGTGLSANGDAIDLLIYGDNAGPICDNVDLSGGWTAAGTFSTSALTGSSITFDVYQASGAQIAVQQGLDLNAA